MVISRRPKTRESLTEILQSVSDTLFPAELGAAPVTLDSTDCDGDTRIKPLHVLLWRGNDYGVGLLIEAGADVNAVGEMGQTPLHVAVGNGNVLATQMLLAAGADITITSEFGETPRQLALGKGGDIASMFRKL